MSVRLYVGNLPQNFKIKELEMKFKVKLGEQLDTLSELTKSMKHEDEPVKAGGISIDMNNTNPDSMAEIKIIFEGGEAPEGVMRINDQLVKTIHGTKIDEATTTK